VGTHSTYPFGERKGDNEFKPEAKGSLAQALAAEPEQHPDFYFLAHAPHSGARPQAHPLAFDVESVRRDFPALHQRVNGRPSVYLDNAATTHKPQSVLDATSRFYGRDNSNIHRAAHALSKRATAAFEAGREKVRRFLGASDKKEIVFVRGTTEGINLVAQTYGRKNIGPGMKLF
jgi:cysteine desulfurase/selenocysteine lyase